MYLLKRESASIPGCIVYLDETGHRCVANAFPCDDGGFLVCGRDDTIVKARDEVDADRIALRFAFAL